jgi:two-component system, NarL family, invasion response regulator UvrY
MAKRLANKPGTIRILLADDHPVVRKGLRETLEEVPGMKVAGQAATGAEALQKILKEKFDVVIMDISLPGRSGLEILEEIKKRRPNIAVLIFTLHGEAEFAVRAIRAGAAGYLTKERPLSEVVEAVKVLKLGEKYLSPTVAKQLAQDLESGGKRPHQRLSNREYQVMLLIASGKSLKQIARQLSLSAKTVTTYRTRILEKLDLNTNASLFQYVLTHRLQTRSASQTRASRS